MSPKNATALNLMHGNALHDLRRSIWLWLHLQSHEAAGFDPATCNSDDMREITTEYLYERDEILLGNIQEEMTRTLLPDEHFDWIGEDARLIAWLLPRLEDLSDRKDFHSLTRLQGRNLVLGMVDLWDHSLTKKAAALDRLQAQWRQHKVLDTQLKWFSDKKEGNMRCEYAWRWIEKNERRALFKRPLPFENYRELLAFFDTADLRERERKDIVQSIRQSWNRQKYLERLEAKEMNQYNFTLSDKAIRLLDRMAEDRGMKRPQLLELLITQESERSPLLSTNRRSVG